MIAVIANCIEDSLRNVWFVGHRNDVCACVSKRQDVCRAECSRRIKKEAKNSTHVVKWIIYNFSNIIISLLSKSVSVF